MSKKMKRTTTGGGDPVQKRSSSTSEELTPPPLPPPPADDVSCLICGEQVPDTAKLLALLHEFSNETLFEALCKCLGVRNSLGGGEEGGQKKSSSSSSSSSLFNNSFPFCQPCYQMMVTLGQLYGRLAELQGIIKAKMLSAEGQFLRGDKNLYSKFDPRYSQFRRELVARHWNVGISSLPLLVPPPGAPTPTPTPHVDLRSTLGMKPSMSLLNEGDSAVNCDIEGSSINISGDGEQEDDSPLEHWSTNERSFEADADGDAEGPKKKRKWSKEEKEIGVLCFLCGKRLRHYSFNEHMRDVHPEGKLKDPKMRLRCKYPSCKARFLVEADLQEHVEGQHLPSFGGNGSGGGGYLCHKCGFTTKHLNYYNGHYKSKHEVVKVEKCHICGKEYKGQRTAKLLSQHLESHVSPVPCPLCGKMIREGLWMKNHMYRMHKGKAAVPPGGEEEEEPPAQPNNNHPTTTTTNDQ